MGKNFDVAVTWRVDDQPAVQTVVTTEASTSTIAMREARRTIRKKMPKVVIESSAIVYPDLEIEAEAARLEAVAAEATRLRQAEAATSPLVYLLDPIPTKLGDPRWQKSRVKECVRVLAHTPAEAREKVARKTAVASQAIERSAPVLGSPWLDEALTTICIVDTGRRTADPKSADNPTRIAGPVPAPVEPSQRPVKEISVRAEDYPITHPDAFISPDPEIEAHDEQVLLNEGFFREGRSFVKIESGQKIIYTRGVGWHIPPDYQNKAPTGWHTPARAERSRSKIQGPPASAVNAPIQNKEPQVEPPQRPVKEPQRDNPTRTASPVPVPVPAEPPQRRAEMSDIDVDRVTVRRLVEDFWRSLILVGRNMGQSNATRESANATALDLSQRFRERNEATAALMPSKQAAAFLKMIEVEDRICFEEHQRDPDALYRRLTLQLTSTPSVPPRTNNSRQGIGEIIVKTAVRATVWELVDSLFRR